MKTERRSSSLVPGRSNCDPRAVSSSPLQTSVRWRWCCGPPSWSLPLRFGVAFFLLHGGDTDTNLEGCQKVD